MGKGFIRNICFKMALSLAPMALIGMFAFFAIFYPYGASPDKMLLDFAAALILIFLVELSVLSIFISKWRSFALLVMMILAVDVLFGVVNKVRVGPNFSTVIISALAFIVMLFKSENKVRFSINSKIENLLVVIFFAGIYALGINAMGLFRLDEGWDQGIYVEMARRIWASEWFDDGGYSYSIGYPFLGSLFYGVMPDHPFLILNLFFYLISIFCFYKTMICFTGSKTASFGFAFWLGTQSVILNFNDFFLNVMIRSWSNIPPIAVSFIMLYIIMTKPVVSNGLMSLMSFLWGLVFACRYGDIIYFIPLMISLFLKYDNSKRLRSVLPSRVFACVFGVSIIVIPVLISHKMYYGGYFENYLTQYVRAVPLDHVFHPFEFKIHFLKILDGFFFPFLSEPGANFPSYLSPMPFVIFLPLGVYVFWKRHSKKMDVLLVGLFVAANILYFTSSEAVGATAAIRWEILRYYAPSLPVIGFFSFYGISIWINSGKRLSVWIVLLIFTSSMTVMGLCRQKPDLVANELRKIFIEEISMTMNCVRQDEFKKLWMPSGYVGEKSVQQEAHFRVKMRNFFPIQIEMVEFLTPGNERYCAGYDPGENEKCKAALMVYNSYGLPVKFDLDYLFYKNTVAPSNAELDIYVPISRLNTGRYRFLIRTFRGDYYTDLYL
ncbi:MAG: hypothetical protein HQK54_06220 [Oligoflexales bacterium]|nr:hypothetical protein [Oligoflexales bacterium]